MPAHITLAEPAQNEFLAALEAKNQNKPNSFFRAMANRPEVLKAFVPFYGTVAGPGSVERRIKELVYLTVSLTNKCKFCTWAHTASGKKAGVTADELAALESGHDQTTPTFTQPELAAIRFAREITKTADCATTRDALKHHFSNEQVVELTLLAALANFTNRFNNGLGIQPDE
jgi:uncharacterized peroxidase-related enzyme